MEIKKSPKADLENKKGIFFQVGLVLSILIVIGLFSWSKPEVMIQKMEQEAEQIEVEEIPLTVQEPPKVEQPKVVAPVISDIIEIVDDKIDVKTDMSAFDTEGGEDMEIVELQQIEQVEEAVDDNTPLVRVEKMPTFQGGDVSKFRDWVQGHMEYPKEARENGIAGKVNVVLTIGKDGSITNVEIKQSPDKSLSEEVIRIIKTAPKWQPGEQRGKPTPVLISVPITFKLL